MNAGIILQMLATLAGGLGIFLLGMKYMSEGVQAVAGERLRKMIAGITNNRFSACATGMFVTCLVQSSSVTTVLVVGLVNSGFMTLLQAAGVIMGANIGTTITGWILVLKLGKYGLPILGLSALFYLFNRREWVRFTAMAVMGVGMIFFGLELMSAAFQQVRDVPEFLALFSAFQADSYLGMMKCVMVGCLVTAIVQSSSATLGITIGLTEAGIIPFPTAAALVLGENIGTTVTALLASIGAVTNARRAAVFHSVFNVVGVMWITAIFPWYLQFIQWLAGTYPGLAVVVDGLNTYPYARAGIAMTHSVFNIANTIVFFPLLPLAVKAICRLIPDRAVKETPRLTYLDVRMLKTPSLDIQQSREEIIRMKDHVLKMLDWLRQILVRDTDRDMELEKKLFRREEILDAVQREITEFVCRMLSGNVPHHLIVEARRQLQITDEYESISDYLVAILKLHLKRLNADLPLSEDGLQEILQLHDMVTDYTIMISEAFVNKAPDMLSKAYSEGEAITCYMRTCRDKHLARITNKDAPPLSSLVFTDMLTSYRKIKDIVMNIAEAMQ
jgi:phosphate:Na+ symporter